MLLLLDSHRREPGAGGVAEKGCIFSSTTGLVHDYYLSAVTALSRNDIWVVGSFFDPPRNPHALLEHWNGSQWCVHPDPYPITEMGEVDLHAIAADSASDAWAVGKVSGDGPDHALIEHWNGSRWSVVPNPTLGTDVFLLGVAAVSPTDAWAVGFYFPDSNLGQQTLIEHWNGKKWSVTPNPFPRLAIDLHGITALSANDVWAVGTSNNGTLILHWNGKRWNIVPSPNPGKSSNQLLSVVAVSANDVWAVGKFTNSTQGLIVEETLTLHWNGSQWTVVPSPSPSNIGNDLVSVTALSTNDIWAVGDMWAPSDNNLIEHWDGSHWSVVRTSNQGENQGLSGVARVPHANTIVAVGVGSLLYILTSTPTTASYGTVPDLFGLNYQDALAKAKSAGFSLTVEGGNTTGVVVGQSPSKGTKTVLPASILVAMGQLTSTPTLTVPLHLVGNTLGSAEQILKNATIPYKVQSAGIDPSKQPNSVINVNPSEGSALQPDQKGTLYVVNLTGTTTVTPSPTPTQSPTATATAVPAAPLHPPPEDLRAELQRLWYVLVTADA